MRFLMKENVEPTNEQCDFGQVINPIRVSYGGNWVPLSVRLLRGLRFSVCHLEITVK